MPVWVRLPSRLQIRRSIMAKKLPEITLEMESKKVGEYSIDNMIQMFGDRIKPAIFEGEYGKGLIAVEMRKLFRKWKTNADIKEAYKHYIGIILVPWIVVNNPPVVMCSAEAMKLLRKEISSSKYKLIDASL